MEKNKLSQILTDAEVKAFHYVQARCFGRRIVEFSTDNGEVFVGVVHLHGVESGRSLLTLITDMVDKGFPDA